MLFTLLIPSITPSQLSEAPSPMLTQQAEDKDSRIKVSIKGRDKGKDKGSSPTLAWAGAQREVPPGPAPLPKLPPVSPHPSQSLSE